MRGPWLAEALPLLAVLALLAACEPVVPDTGGSGDGSSGAGGPPELGAPVRETPQTLVGAVERARPTAQAWQDDPVLVEVAARIEGGRVRTAEVVFLAGDADRFATVSLEGEVVTEARTTLSAIDLQPVTAAGVEEVPELPDDLLDPAALVAAAGAELGGCGIDPAGSLTVRYSTGAPYGWEGAAWAVDLEWTAAVTAGGEQVRVLALDPASGEPQGDCESTS